MPGPRRGGGRAQVRGRQGSSEQFTPAPCGEERQGLGQPHAGEAEALGLAPCSVPFSLWEIWSPRQNPTAADQGRSGPGFQGGSRHLTGRAAAHCLPAAMCSPVCLDPPSVSWFMTVRSVGQGPVSLRGPCSTGHTGVLLPASVV